MHINVSNIREKLTNTSFLNQKTNCLEENSENKANYNKKAHPENLNKTPITKPTKSFTGYDQSNIYDEKQIKLNRILKTASTNLTNNTDTKVFSSFLEKNFTEDDKENTNRESNLISKLGTPTFESLGHGSTKKYNISYKETNQFASINPFLQAKKQINYSKEQLDNITAIKASIAEENFYKFNENENEESDKENINSAAKLSQISNDEESDNYFYIPESKKNNEKFKILQIKKYKPKRFSANRSAKAYDDYALSTQLEDKSNYHPF